MRILDAARRLFVRDGVTGFSMRKLGALAGLSAAAVYTHFADKESLLRDLMAEDCRAFRASLGAAVEAIPDPVERIKAMGCAFVRFAAEQPEHYRLGFLADKGGVIRDPADPRSSDPAQDAHAYFVAAVGEGIRAGRFRPEFADPYHLAQVLWSGVNGVAALHASFGHDPHFRMRPALVTIGEVCDALIRGVLRNPGEL